MRHTAHPQDADRPYSAACGTFVLGEAAGVHDGAGQRMTHDVFREACHFNQRIEVDARLDPIFIAQEHDVFGTNITGRPFQSREGTTAKTGDGTVEKVDAHFQTSIDVGNSHAPRIVQVETDPLIGPGFADLADHLLDAVGCRPTHCVGNAKDFDWRTFFVRNVEDILQTVDDQLRRNLAFEITAESCHDRRAAHRYTVFLIELDLTALDLSIDFEPAICVVLHKGFGRSGRNRPHMGQPVTVLHPLDALLVQPQGVIHDAFFRFKATDHVIGIGPSRDSLPD